MTEVYTLLQVISQSNTTEIATWLSRAFFSGDYGGVETAPQDFLSTQILAVYDGLSGEDSRERLRAAVGECMSRWASTAWSRHDPQDPHPTAFSQLNEIAILARGVRSRVAGYVAYSLLSDQMLRNNKDFLHNCADILIDCVCDFLYFDDFFESSRELFGRESLWRYQPSIFFRMAKVRRSAALRLLGQVLATIDAHEDYFDRPSLAVMFWRLFSAADVPFLLDSLDNQAVANLLLYFIQDPVASPVMVQRDFGTDAALYGALPDALRFPDSTDALGLPYRLAEDHSLDDDLVADGYFLYDRRTKTRMLDTPLGRGRAIEGLKIYERRRKRTPADALGLH